MLHKIAVMTKHQATQVTVETAHWTSFSNHCLPLQRKEGREGLEEEKTSRCHVRVRKSGERNHNLENKNVFQENVIFFKNTQITDELRERNVD